jgi:hypothetical protein
MKPDLVGLEISDNELAQLTGLQDLKRANAIKEFPKNSDVIIRPSVRQEGIENLVARKHDDKMVGIGCVSGIILGIILVMIVPLSHYHYVIRFAAFAACSVAIYLGIFAILQKWLPKDSTRNSVIASLNQLHPTRLGVLLDEADNYNQVVRDLVNRIDAIDQLADIGHAVEVKNRKQIIKAFKTMRADLVRALQTERILREKNLTPEAFTIDFMPFKALDLSGEVQDLDRLVNEATEIGLRVQEEMRKLSSDTQTL